MEGPALCLWTVAFKDLGLNCFFCPRKRTDGVDYFFPLLPFSCFSPRPVAIGHLLSVQMPPFKNPNLDHSRKIQLYSIRRKSTPGGCIDTHGKYSRNS